MSEAIDYYYSHLSPFAYLGHQLLLDLADRHGITINYKPVNLMAVFEATGGLPLGKRHPARIAYRTVELKRWREQRGVDLILSPQHYPTNPMLADCAAIVIANAGVNPGQYSLSVFKAFWAEDKNIADEEVVATLIDAAGMDAVTIIQQAKDAVHSYTANSEQAIRLGVIGSPGYVYQGEPFWGQDRLESLTFAIESGRGAYSAD